MLSEVMIDSDVGPNGFAFTVNSAVTDVPIAAKGGANNFFRNSANSEWFEAGDNVLLDVITVALPYSFGGGKLDVWPSVFMIWSDAGGAPIQIPELSGQGSVFIPGFCRDLSFSAGGGLFLTTPKNQGRVRLLLANVFGNVSMLGVPASLAGQTLAVHTFLQLRHTRPLQAAP